MVVGIMDSENDSINEIENILNKIYQSETLETLEIINLNDISDAKLDVLIINNISNEKSTLLEKCNLLLKKESIILINSDNKEIFKKICGICTSNKIISYGFNSKACVTASSVIHEEFKTIQCCLQRVIPTLSGGSICQQEFSVKVCEDRADDNKNITNILAAVTTALLDDVEFSDVKEFNFNTYKL